MTTITFDTYKLIRTLRDAGVPENQAEAITEGLARALEESTALSLASKQDMLRVEHKLLEHDGEFKLVKWMLGIVIVAEVGPLLAKLFA